jgi:hypothetical protein
MKETVATRYTSFVKDFVSIKSCELDKLDSRIIRSVFCLQWVLGLGL